MDAQLKHGLLEAVVLASLRGGESYGYRIIKDLPPGMELSESTLYPILKRLEAGALVSSRTCEHNGRLRRYYAITDAGKRRIEDFLTEWKAVTDVYEFIRGGKRHEQE